MDVLPNQIIRLAQLGMFEQLSTADSIWVCVSCMTCNSRCPKNVRIAEIIEALREDRLRSGERNDYLRVQEMAPEERAKLPPIAMIGAMRKLTS